MFKPFAKLPDKLPVIPLYSAWTRSGTLRFTWGSHPADAHRLLAGTLSDRPDAPGAPLVLPGRDYWGDVASPLQAARLLTWRWDLGEPVRQVVELR